MEEFIKALNEYIRTERKNLNIDNTQHLVDHSVFKQDKTFKAFKTWEITLWYIDNNSKHRVLTVSQTGKATTEEEIFKLRNKAESCFIQNLLQVLLKGKTSTNNSVIEAIIYGRFSGNSDE